MRMLNYLKIVCQKNQVVEQKDGTFRNVCIIELFGAREHCCGDHYPEIMNRWLPYGKQLEQLKASYLCTGNKYVEGRRIS